MTNLQLSYQRPLDGVRGVAILLVLMSHQHISSFGWTGVQLFFVLSGYLITKILLQEKESSRSLTTQLRNFWMRRVLRIFPVYYLYLLILFIVWLFIGQPMGFIRDLPYLITYTYNFRLSHTFDFSTFPIAHLWSLSVEEQFYLLYPFLIFLCRPKLLKILLVALIAFSICFRFVYAEYLQSVYTTRVEDLIEKTHYMTFSHFDSFLAGGIIPVFRLEKISYRSKSLLFSAALLGMLVSGYFLYVRMWGYPSCITCYISDLGFEFGSMQYYWPYLVLNFFLFTLVWVLVNDTGQEGKSFLQKIFSFGVLVKIGKVSYGMYVIHLGFSYIISHFRSRMEFISNGYLLFILYVIAVYLTAFLSYKFYESRFLRLKEKFR